MDEVGIDGDGCGRAGACRRDHLRTRVDGIARGPHARVGGAPGAVDDREPGLVDVVAEGVGETVLVRDVAGPNEDRRARDDALFQWRLPS